MALIQRNVSNNCFLCFVCVCVCVCGGGLLCERVKERKKERNILAIEKDDEMGVSECKRLGCFGLWGHWGGGYGLDFEVGYSGISRLSLHLMLP